MLSKIEMKIFTCASIKQEKSPQIKERFWSNRHCFR